MRAERASPTAGIVFKSCVEPESDRPYGILKFGLELGAAHRSYDCLSFGLAARASPTAGICSALHNFQIALGATVTPLRVFVLVLAHYVYAGIPADPWPAGDHRILCIRNVP